MKGLDTLIKLHKRKLDELRRQVVSLETQKAQLLALSAKIQQELENEIDLAGKQPEMGKFFGDFAKRIKKRQENIAIEVKSLDKQMDALRQEITAEFSEQKKYEIAKENARLRDQEEANRKETNMLDEVAADQYRRKQKENQ